MSFHFFIIIISIDRESQLQYFISNFIYDAEPKLVIISNEFSLLDSNNIIFCGTIKLLTFLRSESNECN